MEQGRPSVASDPAEDGLGAFSFGFDVAVDGDTAVIGDTGWRSIVDFVSPDSTLTNTGKAYVYENEGGEWTLTAEIQALDRKSWGKFGFAVDIEKDTIVVGAYWDGYPIYPTGAGYVFERTPTSWVQTAKLYANETFGEADLGFDVAIDDGHIALGAPRDNNRQDGAPYPLDNFGGLPSPYDSQSGLDAGSVYLFEKAVKVPT